MISMKTCALAACAALALMAGVSTQAGEASVDVSSGLARSIVEDAVAFDRFVTRAAAVTPAFNDGNAVRRALKTSAAYEPKQLQQGEVAYVALLALQDRGFVERVRDRADRDRGDFAEELMRSPEAVFDMPGANRTAERVAVTLAQHGHRIVEAGKAVKQSAYTVQHQAWSRDWTTDRPQRLALIKTMSATRFVSKPEDAAVLARAIADIESGGRGAPNYPSATVARGLALAALAVMGRAGENDAAQVRELMAEPEAGQCLKMAKLNLFQCLAVAGPRYEDVFCTGEHALMETGRCVIAAADQPPRNGRDSWSRVLQRRGGR